MKPAKTGQDEYQLICRPSSKVSPRPELVTEYLLIERDFSFGCWQKYTHSRRIRSRTRRLIANESRQAEIRWLTFLHIGKSEFVDELITC